MTYTLEGTDAASFDIVSTSGQIQTKTGVTYDYETQSSYSVTVKADDGKGGTATIAVTISVTNLDEAGTITFSPEQPVAGTTLTATLTDQDGVQSVDTWRWEISDDQSSWTEITGAITSSIVPGSSDIGKYLRVTIEYTQTDSSIKPVQAEAGQVLTAPPTNEHPTFADPTTTRSVAENTGADQPIGVPVAADHTDNVGTLVYSLDAIGAETFDIDAATGQLKTKAVFDYETDPTSYTVTVSIADGLDDYSHADMVEDATILVTILVTINVTDVNEKPQFDPNAATTIESSEDAAPNANIGDQYEAIDPDFGDSLTYSVSGTDSALFQVDAIGQLQVKEALDFDTKPTLTVIVSVTDGEDEAGNIEETPVPDDNITITITLTNVFEAPRFSDDDGTGNTTRSVPENSEADQPVGAPVAATDDENDSLTYELGGTDAASFNFDAVTGQIKTKNPLDHESKDSYSVTVSVSDGKADDGTTVDAAMDTHIDVTIEVEDVNELPEFIANLPTELWAPENTAADTPIDTPFTANDPDPADTLAYGLTGTDAASFDIDTPTGQIKTKDNLDHETKGTYNVSVTVRDSRNDNGEADTATDASIDVTITVTDADEEGAITFSLVPPSAGTALTATLRDDDVPISGEAWSWEISDNGQTNWTNITGANASTFTPQHSDIGKYLRVKATYSDSFGENKEAQAVTGAVLTTPPTNQQPSFSDATATRSILENTAADTNIGGPLAAIHADNVGTLVYSLDANDATNFDIDSSTGQLKTKTKFNYETPPTSYTVTVSISDGMDDYSNRTQSWTTPSKSRST